MPSKDKEKESKSSKKDEKKSKHRKSDKDVLSTYTEEELKRTADAGVIEIAEVKFDFDARSGAEISLKKGMYVEILKKTEGAVGWWKGRVRGTTKNGLFPSNYVEILFTLSDQDMVRTAGGSIKMKPGAQAAFLEAAKAHQAKSSGLGSSGSSKKGSKDDKDDKESGGRHRHRHTSGEEKEGGGGGGTGGGEKILVAKVMFDFDARKPTEVSIKRGDEVLVLEKGKPNGWWKGQAPDGAVGLFPSNYTRVEEKDADTWKPEEHYDQRKLRKVEKLKGQLKSLKKERKHRRSHSDDGGDNDDGDDSSTSAITDEPLLEFQPKDDKQHKELRRRLATVLADNRVKAKRIKYLEEKVKVAEELIEYYDSMVKSGGGGGGGGGGSRKKEKNKYWKRTSAKF